MKEQLKRVEETLDGYGFGAWIAVMVAGFVVLWPIGLAVLGYMLWSGRMGCWKRSEKKSLFKGRKAAAGETGNAAFDAYREATLQRLEDEREAFTAFLDRLRQAKDQAEFDQFMTERRAAPAPQPSSGPDSSPGFGGAAPQPAT